ncbi:hypothetical protein B0H67DRAFT_149681 [Lasiosphaeris hirsuta]|uniref:Uncharacterized protein n=1 Tax=Lasiosphaeris hirsuta TaxID=260670 RepID=A0AA40ANW1_9PEZI|nr:hypothetical protein B0H67DRAFT_149681 [Lasiosphaeris hirsuta]
MASHRSMMGTVRPLPLLRISCGRLVVKMRPTRSAGSRSQKGSAGWDRIGKSWEVHRTLRVRFKPWPDSIQSGLQFHLLLSKFSPRNHSLYRSKTGQVDSLASTAATMADKNGTPDYSGLQVLSTNNENTGLEVDQRRRYDSYPEAVAPPLPSKYPEVIIHQHHHSPPGYASSAGRQALAGAALAPVAKKRFSRRYKIWTGVGVGIVVVVIVAIVAALVTKGAKT